MSEVFDLICQLNATGSDGIPAREIKLFGSYLSKPNNIIIEVLS